mmetsp:Transcript_3461/g.14600  ORF Transcript_3461/g.14600 Transcript_3461/m.14600 type:complete len:227 (+) Transcript_3461:1448-2128(+)
MSRATTASCAAGTRETARGGPATRPRAWRTRRRRSRPLASLATTRLLRVPFIDLRLLERVRTRLGASPRTATSSRSAAPGAPCTCATRGSRRRRSAPRAKTRGGTTTASTRWRSTRGCGGSSRGGTTGTCGGGGSRSAATSSSRMTQRVAVLSCYRTTTYRSRGGKTTRPRGGRMMRRAREETKQRGARERRRPRCARASARLRLRSTTRAWWWGAWTAPCARTTP